MDNADEINKKEEAEEKMINDAFQELLNDYLQTKHRKRIEIITKAFNFANQAHKGIKRRSGEPYILHPIAVAKIVCNEIGLGSTSICSALLHDVVEDTDYTIEDIENIFGHKIAKIVEGLTKIAGGIFGDKASGQAENFRKLLLTMSDDIRVILIKIADRLHNMRTLSSMPLNKQYKIAGETQYIYAPLANRLGLNKIKTELENLSFKYEHPEEYKEIESKLSASAAQRDKVFVEFTAPIREQLDKMGLKYRIMARAKSVYSIWKKMQTKHVPFEEIYDILAVRIIFEPKSIDEELNECFDIYVAISKIYKPHPDRLRDWVSHPKANGYQALHVTLMSNNGEWIEVQIRSQRMDEIAEQGFAAHWKYKEGGGSEDEGELEKWLSAVKEILDDPGPDAIDFLDTIKLNLFAYEIFVFTPKGELKTLPQNATALDFAFMLHTDIGSHCIGAKVNHKLVPLSYKLHSGDQVEILTSRSQNIQPEWEEYATTAKAKAKIAAVIRKENKVYEDVGKTLFNSFLSDSGFTFSTSVIDKLLHLHNLKTEDELYVALGKKEVILGEDDKNVIKGKNKKRFGFLPFIGNNKEQEDKKEDEQPQQNKKISTSNIIKLTDDTIEKTYQIAECCHPIPGDDVLGYIDEKNHIIIHKQDCPVALKLKSSYGNRIIATTWDTHKSLSFMVYIQLTGIDGIGVLNQITQVLSRQLSVNIHKLDIESNAGIFSGKLQLYVHDVSDVRQISNELKKIPNVQAVTRVEG
jgi:guanosine-3',5'-bis(diphosphate) 3'-pyrophosphohydrolase